MTKYNAKMDISSLAKHDKAIRAHRTAITLNYDDVSWFEMLLAEAVLATAASSGPLKTLGEAWDLINFRAGHTPKMKGLGDAKSKEHLAAAANNLLKLVA